ncbi:sialidase family protein [Mesomycoplasma hyorhinis]|uniref:sialidase family protein n=1 Tax=Mesomycoplasma hyorhinis TaxID=2100 RepID=UPI003DA37745
MIIIKKTNGRILFTVYWWTWSDPNNSSSVQKQEGIWIYSDDQGQSWPRLAKDPIKDDTFESTFI